MTLSNFDWTDKDCVRWFILLPTGHEGPYSLKQLIHLHERKKMAKEIQVWAEGLSAPVTFKELVDQTKVSDEGPVTQEKNEQVGEEELTPDLPPLPDDEIPPVPEDIPEKISPEEISMRPSGRKGQSFALTPVLIGMALLALFFGTREFLKSAESIDIPRMSRMGPELHERILKENSFSGWDKKIFFREYVSDDHGQIWLINTGFQACKVEASFKSVEGKLLTLGEEEVYFKSRGTLSGHIVSFSDFEFIQGSKIIPGLYELNVKATACHWESFLASAMNGFRDPEKEYLAQMKVVIFSKGAQEFNVVLDRILRQKEEKILKEQNEYEIFWQDLHQKFATLQAITLQIEQLVLDFLQKNPKDFKTNLKPLVELYTRQYGSFLTSFVVENESYFKSLTDSKGASLKRNYELLIRQTSTRIGFESMKLIEEFQSQKKKPRKKELKEIEERVRSVYKLIKQDISQRLLQVSKDQSKS